MVLFPLTLSYRNAGKAKAFDRDFSQRTSSYGSSGELIDLVSMSFPVWKICSSSGA